MKQTYMDLNRRLTITVARTQTRHSHFKRVITWLQEGLGRETGRRLAVPHTIIQTLRDRT